MLALCLGKKKRKKKKFTYKAMQYLSFKTEMIFDKL